MTMSVGLARIIVDPTAGVLTRKALGALSTPGLLVHDTGLSIDDDGRIYIKLKPDGGLIQDSDGLYLEPEAIVVGLDSHVDLFSDQHDREWNTRLTGSAPNYIEAGLAIGSEDFSGTFSVPDVDYDIPKVSITSTTAQLRIAYDRETFTQVKVFQTGKIGLFAIGDNPGFVFESGDGITTSGGFTINRGVEVLAIDRFSATVHFFFDGAVGSVSSQEHTIAVTPGNSANNLSPATDMVTAVPKSAAFLPSNMMSWVARISDTNEIVLRIAFFDELLPVSVDWIFLIHRLAS